MQDDTRYDKLDVEQYFYCKIFFHFFYLIKRRICSFLVFLYISDWVDWKNGFIFIKYTLDNFFLRTTQIAILMKYTKDRIELIKNFPTLLQGKPGSFHPFDVGKTIFRSFSFLSMLYLLSIKLIWKEHAFQQLTSNLSHYDKINCKLSKYIFHSPRSIPTSFRILFSKNFQFSPLPYKSNISQIFIPFLKHI